MPRYQVNNSGAVGFIDPRDLRPYETPPEAWSSVSNIRMINRAAQVAEGRTADVDLGIVTAQALDYYNGPTSKHHIVYADDKILTVDDGRIVNTVSKPGLIGVAYPDDIWITDQLNSIPLATNNRDSPQMFYDGGIEITPTTVSQDFPDWGPGGTYAGARAKIIRAYKNFIVALNVNDVNPFPNMIAWSDAADPGLMPTSWDYTDPTNLAGRTVLGAETGAILAAETLRDDLIIYTEYATYRMTFVGGQFVMRFTKIFDNSGVFGPRSVGAYGERHLVVTKNDIIVHDGQQLQSVGDMRVRNRVFEGLEESDVNRLYVSPYLDVSEMWIGIPENVTKEVNLALVWQWDESAWSLRDLPDSRHLRELPVLEGSAIDDLWDTGPDEPWDTGRDNIWNAGGVVGDLRFKGTSTDGFLYFMDFGVQTSTGFLQRQDINLGSDQSMETVLEVFPRIQGEGPVTITVGSSMTVEGPLQWGAPAVFNPLTDYHITRRKTGRRHSIRFEGNDFRLQGYDIVWEPAGER